MCIRDRHYGLDVIAPDIHTFDGNHTRFVIVSASPTPIGIPDKATVTFTPVSYTHLPLRERHPHV